MNERSHTLEDADTQILCEAVDAPGSGLSHESLARALQHSQAMQEAWVDQILINSLLEEELGSDTAQSLPPEILNPKNPFRISEYLDPAMKVAALLLISLCLWMIQTSGWQGPENRAYIVASAGNSDSLSPLLRPGRAAPAQPLEISSGLIRLQLASGTQILLEAPARWCVTGPNQMKLDWGQIWATVPPEARGFRVDLPNGEVIDLGTQFGLHCDRRTGTCRIQVSQGRVWVNLGDEQKQSREVSTGQELIWTKENGHSVFSDRSSVLIEADASHLTPRRLIDLLDIVADGDGRGQRHERGIEPHTADATTAWWHDHAATGSGHYLPVPWHPMIDGVFIPIDPAGNGVKLDSAGHRFSDFPRTNANFVSPIWPIRPLMGTRTHDAPMENWVKDVGFGKPYNPQGRGLLAVHSNAGITFDLQAIRRAYPGWKIRRFTAVTGNVKGFEARNGRPRQSGDVWVFVDGALKDRRLDITHHDGPAPVAIELNGTARFLTLVATDAANAHNNDQIVFGDPTLELEPDWTTSDSH